MELKIEMTNLCLASLSLTLVTSLGTSITKSTVCIEFTLFLGDFTGLLMDIWILEDKLHASRLSTELLGL
jgi:hypothetical protein